MALLSRGAGCTRRSSIATVRILVLAVGRLRPPYSDDVSHYEKLLSRYARVETVELRDEADVARRVPERAFVSVLDSGGEAFDSVAFSRFLEARRTEGRDLCFVIGGAFGLGGNGARADHRLSF